MANKQLECADLANWKQWQLSYDVNGHQIVTEYVSDSETSTSLATPIPSSTVGGQTPERRRIPPTDDRVVEPAEKRSRCEYAIDEEQIPLARKMYREIVQEIKEGRDPSNFPMKELVTYYAIRQKLKYNDPQIRATIASIIVAAWDMLESLRAK